MSVSLHQQRHRDAALRTDTRCTENAKTVIFAEHQPNTAVNITQRDSAAFFIAGDWAAMDKFLVEQHDLLLGHADSVVLYAQEQCIMLQWMHRFDRRIGVLEEEIEEVADVLYQLKAHGRRAGG